MKDVVRCHAGWHYPEHPLALLWEGEWLNVTHVLHEWHRENGYGYVVRVADERVFELHYLEEHDFWEIKFFSGASPMPEAK